jgi:sulfite reductase (NADPH) flavoprotein alpha-component
VLDLLADRCAQDNTRAVLVQPSHGFKLPTDMTRPDHHGWSGHRHRAISAHSSRSVLATGASGKNWLFFGDQRRATDFLYQETLEEWLADGHLARLDLAFSRDHAGETLCAASHDRGCA